jgi:hypothetical protein
MTKRNLSRAGEVIAAYGAAMVASFQVLINCLEESVALLPGQFPDALRVDMEMVKSRKGDVSDMTLAVLHDSLSLMPTLRVNSGTAQTKRPPR